MTIKERREYMREYHSRPEYKAKMQEYNSRPEVIAHRKEYEKRPEVIARRKEYKRRPEVINRRRILTSTPEKRARQQEYRERPEAKARQKEYQKQYQQQYRKEHREEMIARQREYAKTHQDTIRKKYIRKKLREAGLDYSDEAVDRKYQEVQAEKLACGENEVAQAKLKRIRKAERQKQREEAKRAQMEARQKRAQEKLARLEEKQKQCEEARQKRAEAKLARLEEKQKRAQEKAEAKKTKQLKKKLAPNVYDCSDDTVAELKQKQKENEVSDPLENVKRHKEIYGLLLASERQALGFTQDQFIDLIDRKLTKIRLSHIENGLESPSPEMAELIYTAFNAAQKIFINKRMKSFPKMRKYL